MSGPPFDGSAPCPFCPEEIRNLFAVAHNLVIGSRDTTIGDLANAVESCRSLADAHFADSMHSHGMTNREATSGETSSSEPK